MRLSEPIEKTGFFWAPEDADNRLPGVLRISETGETTLEVFGPSKQMLSHRPLDDPLFNQEASVINRIVGVVGKNESVTLDNCFIKNWNSTFGGLWTSTIQANRAFIGAIYRDGEEATFSKIEFSAEGLDEWLWISGIHTDYDWNDRSAFIRFDPPEEISLHLPEGIEMKLVFRWTLPSLPAITEARITQKAYISLISTKLRSLGDFIPLISKLHNFLCFAIDKTVSLESVTAYSTELTRNLDDGSTYEPPIKVYYQGTPHLETKSKIYWHDMLFLYRDVANDFEEILHRWLKNYETSEPAFNLYFASKSGAHKYLDGNFLSLVQGIETLHRRNSQETSMPEEEFSNLVDTILKNVPNDKKELIKEKLKYANELSLRKRLRKMIEPFRNFFGSSDERRSFIYKVVSTRNYLTHYDGNLVSKTASGKDLLMLYMKLEALFQLHFLRLIGIKDESISAIVEVNRALRYKLGFEPLKPPSSPALQSSAPPPQNTTSPPASAPAQEPRSRGGTTTS